MDWSKSCQGEFPKYRWTYVAKRVRVLVKTVEGEEAIYCPIRLANALLDSGSLTVTCIAVGDPWCMDDGKI